MFEQSTFESAGTLKTKSGRATAVAFMVEGIVVAIMVLIPLIYTEMLPGRGLLTMLVAPPPPPVRRAEVPRVKVVPRAMPSTTQQMVAPRAIPREIAMIEEVPVTLAGSAVVGAIGGVGLGGMINVAPAAPPPPPVEEVYVAPIRVGGQVQAAKMLRQVQPAYPPLARQARIQGTVRLEAIIDRDGNVKSLSVVSGHPLLVQSALNAVAEWKYQPTLLNGVPVEVATTVDVNFVLR
ncbi:MAG: energy transducer TonB [Acidobacteria bacterium]|nr:energy transducer TonB [Acidobacteriota bacterium]